MREFRLLQAPQKPAVDSFHVRWIGLIALVLINSGTTLRPIDDTDGNLVDDETVTKAKSVTCVSSYILFYVRK